MRMQRKLIVVVVGLLGAAVAAPLCLAYSVMWPSQMPSPALPYCVGTDGWGGAAALQMVANTCAGLPGRQYIPQSQIWASVQALNRPGEPAPGWYCDPQGVLASLQPPTAFLGICGGWVDASNANRDYVLGTMLYWIDHYKYMALVSTGPFEHWQVVRGFWSDVQPTWPPATPIALNELYLYDPDYPCGTKIVSAGTWVSDPAYWGTPVNRPGSNWHGKYVLVGEPPTFHVPVRVRAHRVTGTIIPFERALQGLRTWAGSSEAARGLGVREAVQREVEQVLVSRERGSYYLVSVKLGDGRQADVILNAYSGEFEEMRLLPAPRLLRQSDAQLRGLLQEQLTRANFRLTSVAVPEYVLDPELSGLDRYSPAQRARVKLVGPGGLGEVERTLILDREGNVVRGLE
ncbi:MAG: hypothetical protein ABSD56_09370 [Bryobacteraceae bacterium]